MALTSTGSAPAVFELKNTSLPLVAVVLRSPDLGPLADELGERLRETPNLFHNDPVVVDLSALRDEGATIDFPALVKLLREHRMQPIAAAGGSAEQMEAALAAGLSEAPEPGPAPAPRIEKVVQEVIREVVREVPGPAIAVPTMVVDKPLRSGQQVYAKGGDLVVLAPVNIGAEVIADGHVHVYAPLRGKAIAGARGNAEARIFTTHLQAELIAIAGVYRTSEQPLPADVAGKPSQIRLVGDKLVMGPLES
jgi:septum site-determining protein MinC